MYGSHFDLVSFRNYLFALLICIAVGFTADISDALGESLPQQSEQTDQPQQTDQSQQSNLGSSPTAEQTDQFFEEAESYLPNQPDSVLRITFSFLEAYPDIPETRMARIYDNIAKSYFYKGFYNLAKDYYEKALNLPSVQSSLLKQRVIKNNLGAVLDKLGEYEKSLNYYLQVLEIEKQIGTPLEIAEVYNNMSLIFNQTKDTSSALEMIDLAHALTDTLAPHPLNGLLAMNRGIIYYEMERREEAGEQFLKAAEIFGDFGFYRDQVQTMHNYIKNESILADPEEDDFTELFAIWDEAWAITEAYEMTELQAYLTLVRGDIEVKNGNPEVALDLYSDAEARFIAMEDRPDLIPVDLHNGRLLAYQQTGNVDGMMETIKRRDEIREASRIEEQSKAIQEVKVELDVAETELALKEKEAEAAETSLQLQKQKTRTNILLIFSAFVLIFSMGIFVWHQERVKQLKEIYYINQRTRNKDQTLRHYLTSKVESLRSQADASFSTGLSTSAELPQASELPQTNEESETNEVRQTNEVQDTSETSNLDEESGTTNTEGERADSLQELAGKQILNDRPPSDQVEESEQEEESEQVEGLEDFADQPVGVQLWVHQKTSEVMKNLKLYNDPDIKLLDVAHAVGIGARSLSKTIQFYENMSFKDYINELRILEAMTILENEESNYLSLESIMEDCGFKNRSTFHAVFQKFCGMTPNQYRKISQMEKRKDAVPKR